MPRNCGFLAAIITATLAVAVQPTSLQNRIAVYDYDEYRSFLPVARFEKPIVVKKKPKKDEQDFSKIPGIPGVDYPIFHTVPPTSFSCAHVPILPGMYANVETGCQGNLSWTLIDLIADLKSPSLPNCPIHRGEDKRGTLYGVVGYLSMWDYCINEAYHVCHDGREGHQGASFLCTNGTLFNQQEFNCDWWYNVNCANAPAQYRLNADPLKNPYVPQAQKDAIRENLRIVVY